MSKLTKGLIFILFITATGISGVAYWQYSNVHPSTDDAYINAHRATISSEVSGRVIRVYVKENQAVKKGQVLFDIDPLAYALRKEKLKAQLQLTEEHLRAAQDIVNTAASKVKQAEAILQLDKKNAKRILSLARDGRVSKAKADDARTKLNVSRSTLVSAKSQLQQSQQELGEIGKNNAKLRLANADLSLAMLDLAHTRILAPATGIITQIKLREGDMVQAGAPLFVEIETQHWWLDANFKETQLTRIKNKQRAYVTLDMYPNKTFIGTVESISPGSGSSFSLLPAENASGNWVKITQRFPIKITLNHKDPRYPLRVGATASVTIDTTKPAG